MIFQHRQLEKTLEWTENNHLCELVIESPVFLRQVLKEFNNTDEKHSLSFTEAEKLLSFENDIGVICNPLKLDFNNRRATTTLLKMLVKSSLSETFYLETSKLKSKIVKYLGSLIDNENFNFEVVSDDFSIDDLAKATSLHIVGDEDDFIELITDYMTMMTELASTKMFIFMNLRSLLTEDELIRLRRNLDNRQINVLMVEDVDRGKLDGVQRIIVDKDRCEV